MESISITYPCTVAQWNEAYIGVPYYNGHYSFSEGNPFGKIMNQHTAVFFKRKTVYQTQGDFDFYTSPDNYGINISNAIYSKRKDIKYSITPVYPGNPVPLYQTGVFNPGQNPPRGIHSYLNPNLANPDPTLSNPQEGICYAGVRLDWNISVNQKLTRPDTDRVDFTITITYEPYSYIQETPYVPSVSSNSTSTPPTYLEQRIALQKGINANVVDLGHRQWGGSGEIRSKQNIINNNIKDESAAERIGQYAIEKSKRNLPLSIPAPPLFQLEPLKFLRTSISHHKLEVYEPIDTIKFSMEAMKKDFIIDLRGIGK